MSNFLYKQAHLQRQRQKPNIYKKMPALLTKLLNILIILRIFYCHTLLATIRYYLGTVISAQSEWARLTFEYFRVKLEKCQGSKDLLPEGKFMVFANHRSQGDFFLHNVIGGYQTNFLSRMAVLIASPIFIVSYKTVWFFNRNNKTDPQKRFNEWLDKKFRQSPRRGFLVYPQGHRMQGTTKVDPTKMKTGMLKYAYRRKIPSQILMSFGNEQVFDEKKLHLGWDETVVYKFSQVIDPSKFSTQGEFVEKIKGRFCEMFDQVFQIYSNKKNK